MINFVVIGLLSISSIGDREPSYRQEPSRIQISDEQVRAYLEGLDKKFKQFGFKDFKHQNLTFGQAVGKIYLIHKILQFLDNQILYIQTDVDRSWIELLSRSQDYITVEDFWSKNKSLTSRELYLQIQDYGDRWSRLDDSTTSLEEKLVRAKNLKIRSSDWKKIKQDLLSFQKWNLEITAAVEDFERTSKLNVEDSESSLSLDQLFKILVEDFNFSANVFKSSENLHSVFVSDHTYFYWSFEIRYSDDIAESLGRIDEDLNNLITLDAVSATTKSLKTENPYAHTITQSKGIPYLNAQHSEVLQKALNEIKGARTADGQKISKLSNTATVGTDIFLKTIDEKIQEATTSGSLSFDAKKAKDLGDEIQNNLAILEISLRSGLLPPSDADKLELKIKELRVRIIELDQKIKAELLNPNSAFQKSLSARLQQSYNAFDTAIENAAAQEKLLEAYTEIHESLRDAIFTHRANDAENKYKELLRLVNILNVTPDSILNPKTSKLKSDANQFAKDISLFFRDESSGRPLDCRPSQVEAQEALLREIEKKLSEVKR